MIACRCPRSLLRAGAALLWAFRLLSCSSIASSPSNDGVDGDVLIEQPPLSVSTLDGVDRSRAYAESHYHKSIQPRGRIRTYTDAAAMAFRATSGQPRQEWTFAKSCNRFDPRQRSAHRPTSGRLERELFGRLPFTYGREPWHFGTGVPGYESG